MSTKAQATAELYILYAKWSEGGCSSSSRKRVNGGVAEGSVLLKAQPVTINALVHRFRLGGDLHLGAQRLGDGVKGRQVADVLLPQVRIKDAHVRSARRQGGHVSQLGFEDVSGTCIATERRGHLLLRHLKLSPAAETRYLGQAQAMTLQHATTGKREHEPCQPSPAAFCKVL